MSKKKFRSRQHSPHNNQGEPQRDGKWRWEQLILYSTDPESSALEFITPRRRDMSQVQVCKKSDMPLGPRVYRCKWVPGQKKGEMKAAIRINGRPVFAIGRKPEANGRDWAFTLVGDNERRTVYFARLVDPKSEPIKIEKTAEGKFVCKGRKPIKTFFHPAPAVDSEFALYQHGSQDPFVPDYWYELDDENAPEDYEPTEMEQHIEEVTAGVIKTFRLNPPCCPSCKSYVCECDGTATDGVPLVTTHRWHK
jgi:hypothetical protein